jgi:hypothetical protein
MRGGSNEDHVNLSTPFLGGRERLPAGDRLRPRLRSSWSARSARALSCRTVCSAVVLACALPATLALGASSAGAYVRINELCILRAFEPAGGRDFVYVGAVDCSGYGNVWTSIEVCAEVQNTVSGQWYLINGSCVADGPTYRALNELGSSHEGLCGVNYRTWDYGAAWHGGGGGPTGEWGHAEYRSSPVKVC